MAAVAVAGRLLVVNMTFSPVVPTGVAVAAVAAAVVAMGCYLRKDCSFY